MSLERVVTVDPADPRLGRQVVHDSRSRAFPLRIPIVPATWHDKAIRVYDPYPNPNQTIGNCTGVAKCVQFNSIGNRKMGQVLKMVDADRLYSLATTLDPWEGSYPPADTGSSGLAVAKAAQALGLGGEYRWLFGGADEVIQAIMEGLVVNVGTWWYFDMFEPDTEGKVRPTGGQAGGHEWSARGYDLSRDLILGRCWWGGFRDFWISRVDLDSLLQDDGDALVQRIAA